MPFAVPPLVHVRVPLRETGTPLGTLSVAPAYRPGTLSIEDLVCSVLCHQRVRIMSPAAVYTCRERNSGVEGGVDYGGVFWMQRIRALLKV
jgi:hypothetical protein